MKIKLFFISIVLILGLILTGCIELKNEEDNKPINFEFAKKYEVTVLKIIDGDTIDVKFENGSTGRIRFLGIDTPETDQSKNFENEYENITNLTCLTNWGLKAKSYTSNFLSNNKVLIEFDENAGFKGGYGRWLSYVYLTNGSDFNKMLLKNGYARVYESESFSKKEEYLQTQNETIQELKGLWVCNS